MNSPINSSKTNHGLLFLGLIMVFSGLLLQINFHMGVHGPIDINMTVWGLSRTEWSMIHKISIVLFTFLMVNHIILHWRWYKAIVTKKLFAKNKLTLLLSFAFIMVAITGYVPWIIMLTGGDSLMREIFVEIHDKIALILIGLLVFHVSKRLKWFRSTSKRNMTKRTRNNIR